MVVKEVLYFKEVHDDRRVPLGSTRFHGHAVTWWMQLKASRVRAGKSLIRSWVRRIISGKLFFLTSHNYDQTMYTRLMNLKQETRYVDDYAEEFYSLLTRNKIHDSDIQLVSHFTRGLHPQMQSALSQFKMTNQIT